MILTIRDGIPFYQYPNLAGIAGLFHGIFTRHGGVSQAPFESLNVSFSVGDEHSRVGHNRELVRAAAGCERLFLLNQIHDRRVVILTRDNLNEFKSPPRADAVITDLKGIGLAIKLADCQSVMLIDRKRRVIANVHSGWRGSIENVIGHTVSKMIETFDCNPAEICAGIGPSLGLCCAEFIHYQREIPGVYWRYKNSDNHFNFWAVSRDQLLAAGLAAENISISGICTKCNTDMFFSYRGEKVTGRFVAVIALT